MSRTVGLDEIEDVLPGAAGSRVGGISCGIGRNLFFGTEMGFEIQSHYLVTIEDRMTGGRQGRWHVVLTRRST